MKSTLIPSRLASRQNAVSIFFEAMDDHEGRIDLCKKALTVVVLGASGDLSRKKTFPALFELSAAGLLPPHANIVGYSRSEMTHEAFRKKLAEYLNVSDKSDGKDMRDEFLSHCFYHQGAYASVDDVQTLADFCKELEADRSDAGANRIFYMALPPSVFGKIGKSIKEAAMSPTGWSRVIVEKPFGRDLESSNELAAELGSLFSEEQIYRIDHYLGKAMVQNLMILRFANSIYEPLWNKRHISCFMITFKEPHGVEGRGSYFDSYGILRDVLVNHLLQIFSLLAMEAPKSTDSEHVRDAKVAVLKQVCEIKDSDVVIGQYEGWEKRETARRIIQDGYVDDESVPKDSKTPTFASLVLHVDNDRWRGVPFILKCGKGLNERKAEVRVQFKRPDCSVNIYPDSPINELVMRVQPDEAVYCKMNNKGPGLRDQIRETELDMTYRKSFTNGRVPDAYERLIYDVMLGHHEHFVRTDELEAAWKIFTPLLHRIDDGQLPLQNYAFGTRGPQVADDLARSYGFQRSETYQWKAKK